MKNVLFFALVLGFAFNASAENRYLRLDCRTKGAFPAQKKTNVSHSVFLILKNSTGSDKVDVVQLDKNEGKYVYAKPRNSALSGLNENTTSHWTKSGLTIRGDSDGFYIVSLTLTAASGYTHGVAFVRDTGEGFGSASVEVNCEKLY